jgi:hypothetical protein
MKNNTLVKAMGVLILIIAVAIAVIPQFTNCFYAGKALTTDAGKQIPMKCYWTAISEIATALPLFAIGLLIILSRHKESLRNLSILGILVGILVILIPSSFIGVCQMPTMICASVMKPILLTGGSISIIASIIVLVISLINKDK